MTTTIHNITTDGVTVITTKVGRTERPGTKSRVFVWTAETNADERQERAARRALMNQELGELALGAKFSRTAGCSCGCSPGFVLQTEVGREFFVTEAAL